MIFPLCVKYFIIFIQQSVSKAIRGFSACNDLVKYSLGFRVFLLIQIRLGQIGTRCPLIGPSYIRLSLGQMIKREFKVSFYHGPDILIVRLLINRYSFIRSEEHTSELQSLMRISYAVFCLKKKKQQFYNNSFQI